MIKIRLNVLILVGLFVITAAIYSKAAYFPFCVVDDNDYVTKNLQVASGLTPESIRWAFTAFHASNWHPVTWLSLMLDSQLFGDNPMGYHLVNVVLHALNTSLLFLLFSSTTGAVWRSAFLAACFALHPLHVESVAWIAERKDVLSTLFWILTLLYYSGYVQQAKRRRYYYSLAAFALGLMAKPMLVTIPIILLLFDIWPLERLNMRFFTGIAPYPEQQRDFRQLKLLLWEKIPFALFAAGSSLVTLSAQKPSISTLRDLSGTRRVANALWALVMYMEKMFFPIDLAIFYPLVPIPLWKAACAAVLLSGIFYVVLKNMVRRPYVAVGWFWYLVTLLPVLGLIQVGSQSMADRYTYIPLIGLFVIASWGGAELGAKAPKLKNTIGMVAAGALLVFFVATWNQLGYWRDNIRLLLRAIDVTESNSFAHFSLGDLYHEQGKPGLAFDEYMEVLRTDPMYPDPQYHNNFGCALVERGMVDAALERFNFALLLNPNDKKAEINLQKALRLKDRMSGK